MGMVFRIYGVAEGANGISASDTPVRTYYKPRWVTRFLEARTDWGLDRVLIAVSASADSPPAWTHTAAQWREGALDEAYAQQMQVANVRRYTARQKRKAQAKD